MSDLVPVLISVDSSQPGGLVGIAAALRALGVEGMQVLEELGTITGRCPEDRLAEVARLPGVKHVDRQRGAKIPPPGSPIQ